LVCSGIQEEEEYDEEEEEEEVELKPIISSPSEP
jgi:hypothetical protein